MDRAFWLAIYRAARTLLPALEGKSGAAEPRIAGKDALKQVIAAIERRYDITPKD